MILVKHAVASFLAYAAVINVLLVIVYGPGLYDVAAKDTSTLNTLILLSLVFGVVGILAAITEYIEARKVVKE